MGVFGGIKEAQENGKLPWLSPGFQGDVNIDRMVYKITRGKGEPAVITEFTVLSTNMPKEHPVGSRRSWYQSMKEKQTGLGALKGFLYGVFGAAKTDVAKRAMVDDRSEEVLDEAVGEKQVLANKRLHVQCDTIQKKDKTDFTLYTWGPFKGTAPAAEVTTVAA